jgi:hypothetical protein
MTKEEKAERNHKNQIQRKNTVLAAEKIRANQEEEVVHEMIKEMKTPPEKDLNPDQDHDPKPTRMKIVEIHQEETEIIKEVTVVVMLEIEMMIEEEIMDQEEEEIILIGIVEEVIMREGMEIMNIEEDLEAIMDLEKEEIEEMITTTIITEEEETTEMIRTKLKRRVGVLLK